MARLPTVDAIVLAAGESRRMGSPKALLPLQGRTFLEKIIDTLADVPLHSIVVVLGANADQIRAETRATAEIIWLINPRYAEGQLSSLQSGLRRCDPKKVDGFLMALVDHPLVTSCSIRALLRKLEQNPDGIIVPTFQARRGHPVLFASRYYGELLTTPPEAGARAVVHAHAERLVQWPVQDPGVVEDIDTPELYEAVLKRIREGCS